MKITLAVPKKAVPAVTSRKRYIVLHGGRGSAKSHTVARILVSRAAKQRLRILCTREMQNSIRDSVYRLLCDIIHELRLDAFFEIQKDTIRSACGSEFIFKGLRHNASEIKSTEGIDICWVEEAEKVSEDSWIILIPTIRRAGSQIYVVFNPEDEKSATYQRFIANPPDDCIVIEMNYTDNPWFPDVLRREMEHDKRVDFEKYEHIWCGKVKRYAHALIFKDKVVVDEFDTPDGVQFYFGADWGFSIDPTVLGRLFIRDRCLYIDYEAYAVGVELEELPAFFDMVPDSRKWEIIADSARPETISFMRNKGFNIVGAEKGKGSVEDGIMFLRGFDRIIIHPRCRGAIDNFFNYKWKTDRITGLVLPMPADGSDHWPDTARYALERYIKRDNGPMIW